jgi:aspartyl-tRNA(Asn)/glutamyl-tRNA(Gln) amidotransferase subunit A
VTAGDLAFMSIAAQARLVCAREISPVELVGSYLNRIEKWDSRLRAYITVCADEALKDAALAEREIAAGRYRGALHGIPYGLKDQICTAGVRTTAGSKILRDFIPATDATVVARMREAGALLIGKHNLHEFGKGSTKDFAYGQPRNPWNLDHSASSSSSGTGVAVAAGLCAGGLGADMGGSIRGPAEANGIVGLRPTFGRVSRFGALAYSWNADTIGPLTRNVADCAIILRAIAGADTNDPMTSRRPVPDYLEALSEDLRGVRAAVVTNLTWLEETHPNVASAVQEALLVIRGCGAVVDDIALPLSEYATVFQSITTDVDSASVFLRKWLRTNWHEFDSGTRTRFAASCLIPAVVYDRAMRGRAVVRREILQALERYDVLITPTSLNPPPRLAEERDRVSGAHGHRRETLRRFTSFPFSVANTPAIAVPMGFSESGLPLSIQIAAKPFDEAAVLRVAHAYERSTAWHERHPDLDTTVRRFESNESHEARSA